MSNTLDTYKVCKDINAHFGCPPVPEKYTGQFSDVCEVWDSIKGNLSEVGGLWTYDGTRIMLEGFKFHSHWPVYSLSVFVEQLLAKGLIKKGSTND